MIDDNRNLIFFREFFDLKHLILQAENPDGIANLLKVLSWDPAHIFPCLDLIRLVILHPINQERILFGCYNALEVA